MLHVFQTRSWHPTAWRSLVAVLFALALTGCFGGGEQDECPDDFQQHCDGNTAVSCHHGSCGFGPCSPNVLKRRDCTNNCVTVDAEDEPEGLDSDHVGVTRAYCSGSTNNGTTGTNNGTTATNNGTTATNNGTTATNNGTGG